MHFGILLDTVLFPHVFCLQFHNKLRNEAKERGEKYKITQLRRNIEMDEYDLLHWRRSFEEREALIRDISWYTLWFYFCVLFSWQIFCIDNLACH